MFDTVENQNQTDQSYIEKRDKFYKSSELAEMSGIAESTVRKYAKILESMQYTFKKDTAGFRIYTNKELALFKDIIDIRNKTGIGIEQAIAVALTRINRGAQVTQSVQQPSQEHLIKTLSDIEKQIKAIQESFLDKISALQKDKITFAIAQKRVERKLKKKAEAEWEKLDDEDKLMVVGRWPFKRKIENSSKKAEFIHNYIDEYFESELLREFNVE